ncbi:MAG: alpha/beta hydrolase [Opitutae bacterium]|nr:alpha/beta hydrolase [Opitutae bacterium]
MRFASALLVAPALGFLAGCASLPDSQSAEVRGHRLEFARTGAGTPTVVFEAGLGDSMSVWADVLPGVSAFAPTFAYSRAGAGGSGLALERRDGARIVAELRALLQAQGVRPPYLLVGHSLGGLYQQLFARLYPAEVAGLVLVDSTHPDQNARFRAALPVRYAQTRAMLLLAAGPMSLESSQIERTGEQVRAAGPLPRVPTIVLSATQTSLLEGADFRKFFLTLQDDLVAQTPGAEHWLAAHSGHYIQRDEPELVVRAIRQVWTAATQRAP